MIFNIAGSAEIGQNRSNQHKFGPNHPKINSKREYGTEGSQVITDLSTNRACGCLTSQIGRDMVFSAKYGRTRSLVTMFPFDLKNTNSRGMTQWRGVVQLFKIGTMSRLTYAIKDTVSVLYWYWKLSGLISGTILRKNLRIFFI